MKKLCISLIFLIFIGTLSCFLFTNKQNSNEIIMPFGSDLEYKAQIIANSGKRREYKLENLSSLMGPYELAEFIKKNDNNKIIYTPSNENIKTKEFSANFHSHTTNSDGSLTVTEYLDLASSYATPTHPFYLAITDHNNMETGKQIIDILQKNPEKYKNLKIAIGMEVFAVLPKKFLTTKDPIEIHIVCLGFDPYEPELNWVFKNRTGRRSNYSYRTYQDALELLSRKGLTGIAHPARYTAFPETISTKRLVNLLFNSYKKICKNRFHFTEGHYQSYTIEDTQIIEYIDEKATSLQINKSGGIDNHGKDFFKR